MKKVIFLILFFLPFFLPVNAFSQTCFPPCPTGYSCENKPGIGVGCVASSSSCTNSSDVFTALGCIPTDPAELVKWILGWSIAMGGGIAFLLSLWGGVTIILAGGNPEKMNEGKEIITSAVSGLLFILFSVFLLRLIGVNILEILKL